MFPAGKRLGGFLDRQKHAASKEPEEEAGGPWLNLWVGNLSPETVDEDLMAVFRKYGAMEAVTTYIPRTYAFVYFRTIGDAKAAKNDLQGTLVRGRPIRIEFARPAKPGKTLWVGGISHSVTTEQLEDQFRKFGKIEEFKFLRDRGSAFIGFHNIEDAIAAQKSMNWKHLCRGEIRVDFQRSPLPRKAQDWLGEDNYHSSGNLALAGTLIPADQLQYSQNSPNHGFRRLMPFGGIGDGQPSNVLWVIYPPELPIDEELLHNSMILFGEIESIKTFPFRHFCFVEFRSVDEARRAKEGLQGRLLGDSRIQILFADGDLIFGMENPQLGQEMLFNEPSIGPVELHGPARLVGPNSFPGRLTPNDTHTPNLLMRPFAQGLEPPQGGFDLHDSGVGMHSFPDNISNNPVASNWKRSSSTGIISSGPGIGPPLKPAQGSWDEFDVREPKRSRIDGIYPSNDRFHREIVEGDDISGVPELPHPVPRPDRILSREHHLTPDIRGHGPSHASPGVDFCWRGLIAKGGTPVCNARCVPIGNGIESPFPEMVNCSARTGLDMLTTHYNEAIGFDMVYFLPDSEEDFASYTEFLRYLGQRDRAGVAKFDDGTTLFLVPPSEFLTKVLKFSGPERLYGVVLKLPLQIATVGQQKQAIPVPPDPVDSNLRHSSLSNYDLMVQNEEHPQKLVHRSSPSERPVLSLGDGRPKLPHAEELHAVRSQDHSKSHETNSHAEVSLTPELIATLASLIPKSSQPSSAITTPMPSTSAISDVFSGPQISDNSMFVHGWGQEARAALPGTSLEQVYNPMQNLQPSGHQFTNQVPLVTQFPTYHNIPNGVGGSFPPAMGGMQMQNAALNMPQVLSNVGTLGNMVPSQVGQFSVLPSNQPTEASSIYHLPIHQQAAHVAASTCQNANVFQLPAGMPLTADRLNVNLPSQVRPLQAASYVSVQGTAEGDADKDQRYQSTLQFAASLLLQIQQQQQAQAQAGRGSGNQQ
ncbi:Flowering time control protein FPA [Apostasia shenzhenica]|uniref:Flowering time control protein FPA n=1 Tax=Apostasia shenzhenica TaxID=1088818 RepID=A0A2I0AL67_9ASPA|nr:Flowering time control protein FPA [Apostasia shenzhenica]